MFTTQASSPRTAQISAPDGRPEPRQGCVQGACRWVLTPLSVGGRTDGNHSPLGTDEDFEGGLVRVTRPSLKGQTKQWTPPFVNHYANLGFSATKGFTYPCD